MVVVIVMVIVVCVRVQDVESALEQFEESMMADFYYAGSRHAKFCAVRARRPVRPP